eukprot:gene27604-61178_t
MLERELRNVFTFAEGFVDCRGPLIKPGNIAAVGWAKFETLEQGGAVTADAVFGRAAGVRAVARAAPPRPQQCEHAISVLVAARVDPNQPQPLVARIANSDMRPGRGDDGGW